MIDPLFSHAPGYDVHEKGLVAGLAIFVGLLPFVGYWIVQVKNLKLARTLAWTATSVSVATVERLSLAEPSGIRMLLITGALLWSMKAVVGVESLQRGGPLRFRNWLAFVLFWFGMRPNLFAKFSNQPRPDWKVYVVRGLIRMAFGAVLFVAAYVLVFGLSEGKSKDLPEWRLWVATACLMPGISLLMHFGLFNLLVGFWRRQSINCTPLFRAPLLSTSLTEFWGKRWNLASSEMTSLSVFRPIKSWLGRSAAGTGVATGIAFLFSGLLHELAISVPVQAGFGFPLLYFLLHGIGMLIEAMLDRHKVDILKRPWIGRVWTWVWVLLPLPILFHRPFLVGCVWPLIGIAG